MAAVRGVDDLLQTVLTGALAVAWVTLEEIQRRNE